MAYTGYVNKDVQAMYGIPYHQLTPEQKKILHADSVRRSKLIKERQDAVIKNNKKAFDDEAKMERVLASIYKECQKQILADVAETMAKVKKAGGTWSYANQSALTRSRGLFEQIAAELNKMGQKEQIVFTKGLEGIYTDQFLRQVYELGQTMTVKANFNRLNPALIKKTLDYPWSGAMFSDRLWLDKETLGRNLRVGLTQSMVLGEGIPEITDRISRNMETSRHNAERIARTETKRVTYCAHNDAYEDMGVEELEYYAAGEKSASAVCDICNADNGKIFKRGEEPSLPRHPNCKCVYKPHVSDTFGDNELNELTGSVRGAENYEKWRKAEEEKLKKTTTLSKEERDYQSIVDDLSIKYKATETEITSYQSEYDTIKVERDKLSSVRRGLQTPVEAGFVDKKAFEAYDAKLTADQQALSTKITGAQQVLKDLSQDMAYVQAVGIKRVKTLPQYREIRKALKNNPTFDYDKYGDELLLMVSRMDDDTLTIHCKLSDAIVKSNYNSGKGGKGGLAVSMTMSHNHHETARGNGLLGSWETKYHEEGHVLDHLLGARSRNHTTFTSAGTGKYSDRTKYMTGFLDTKLLYGEESCDKIGDDILSFINDAITWSNTTKKTQYSPQKTLTRISADSKYACIEYLKHISNDEGVKPVDMSMFTDALGCYTKGSIHPWAHGFWGHDAAYCKEGKQMAVAESWATFCYIRGVGTPEEVAVAKRLMPTTYALYESIYHDIAVYLSGTNL